MSKKYCVSLVIFTALVFLAFGCATERSSVKSSPFADFTTLSSEGVAVSARYLSRENLRDQFGSKNNPFSIGTQVVFELAIDSTEGIRFDPNATSLTTKGNAEKIVHKERYKSIAYAKIEGYRTSERSSGYNPAQYKNWDYEEVWALIDEHVLFEESNIDSGADYEGFLVFLLPVPKNKTALLKVPVYTDSGKLLDDFVFEFMF
jgi:hypothetical protein